jgi:hypothetical protein
MNRKFNLYITYLFYYASLVSCTGLILSLFYFAFLRLRAFKVIPFELTELRFYLLVYLCLTYLYIIFRLLKPKTPPEILVKIFQLISKPFTFLDLEIKYKLLKNYYAKIFLYLVPLLDNITFFQRNLIYYCFNIIPRFILLSLFLIDVFYFNKIEIFYYFIFLGLFPFIYIYCLYSLKVFLEGYIKYLEEFYDQVNLWEIDNPYPSEWLEKAEEQEDGAFEFQKQVHSPLAIYHDKTVTLREYIKIQYDVFIARDEKDKNTYYEYEAHVFAKENIYAEYKEKIGKTVLDLEDDKKIHANFNLFMPKLVILYQFIELNKLTQSQKIFVYIKVLIYSLYLISWMYIIYQSYISVDNFDMTLGMLEILSFYTLIFEPFSDTSLYELIP